MKRFAIFLSSLSAFLIALSLTSCAHKTQPLSIEEEKAPVTVESIVILPPDISKPDTADKKTVVQLKTHAFTGSKRGALAVLLFDCGLFLALV